MNATSALGDIEMGASEINSDLLRSYLAELGWTNDELARKTGASRRTIERVLKHAKASRRVYSEILEAVQMGLKERRTLLGLDEHASKLPQSLGSGATQSEANRFGKETSNVADVSEEESVIEISIDRDFDQFTEQDQSNVLSAIQKLLDSTDVVVIRRRRGSVKLQLLLSSQNAERLKWAIYAGDLALFRVTDATIIEQATDKAEWQDLCGDTALGRTCEIERDLEFDASDLGTVADPTFAGVDQRQIRNDGRQFGKKGKDRFSVLLWNALIALTILASFFAWLWATRPPLHEIRLNTSIIVNEDAPNTVLDLSAHFVENLPEFDPNDFQGAKYRVIRNSNAALVNAVITDNSKLELDYVRDTNGQSELAIQVAGKDRKIISFTLSVQVLPIDDPFVNDPPVILDLSVTEEPTGFLLEGRVFDESPGGLTITFGGVWSGHSTTTDFDGSFFYSVPGSESGPVVVSTVDSGGLHSMPVSAELSVSP